MHEKSLIHFRVADVDYNFGTGSDVPYIVLQLNDFEFAHEDSPQIDIGGEGRRPIWLYLTKSMFWQMSGHHWEGTREDVEKIKPQLVGKVFQLKLDLKDTNIVPSLVKAAAS